MIDNFEGKIVQNCVYRAGFCKDGSPLMVFLLCQVKDFEEAARFPICYTLQMIINTMDLELGVDRWTILLDFKGFSMRKAPAISDIQSFIKMMNHRFPGRLLRFYMKNSPWLFSGMWSLISNFMAADTRQKFTFVKKNKEFLEHIDQDQLPAAYGGNLEFSPEHYWEAERQIWRNEGYVQ
eukprot:TRINITY_DN6581_c0_g1_i1.p1 TRINITY_DN6581_c0_g1~~TRINITY_DN6581_c0_g1_i1.p1  ORF type:complete len:180 (+),score=29.76 TRINITY_DN6581_c0_g1_i1:406-945(+)